MTREAAPRVVVHEGLQSSHPVIPGTRVPVEVLVACLAVLASATLAAEPRTEVPKRINALLVTPDGLALEWKGHRGQAPSFRLKKVPSGHASAAQGWREGDEILRIGDAPLADAIDLRVFKDPLAAKWTVRRKGRELELPALFRSVRLLTSSDGDLKPGSPAPPVEVMLREAGKSARVDLLERHRGQLVLLHFWATWCPPCLKEMPVIDAIHQKYAPLGLTVVGLNCDEERSAMSDFLASHPARYGMVRLGSLHGPTSYAYGLSGIPLSVLVDREGRVAQVVRGFAGDGHDERLAGGIETLLDPDRQPLYIVLR